MSRFFLDLPKFYNYKDLFHIVFLNYYGLLTEKEERIQREKEQGTYKEKVRKERVFQNKSIS